MRACKKDEQADNTQQFDSHGCTSVRACARLSATAEPRGPCGGLRAHVRRSRRAASRQAARTAAALRRRARRRGSRRKCRPLGLRRGWGGTLVGSDPARAPGARGTSPVSNSGVLQAPREKCVPDMAVHLHSSRGRSAYWIGRPLLHRQLDTPSVAIRWYSRCTPNSGARAVESRDLLGLRWPREGGGLWDRFTLCGAVWSTV